jgi:hypothetical protein
LQALQALVTPFLSRQSGGGGLDRDHPQWCSDVINPANLGGLAHFPLVGFSGSPLSR